MHAGFRRQAAEFHLWRGCLPEGLQVRERIAGGDDAQAVARGGQPFEQCGDAIVFKLPVHRWPGRVLQRLQAIKDEERLPLANELCQPPTFVDSALCAIRHCWVAEETESFR